MASLLPLQLGVVHGTSGTPGAGRLLPGDVHMVPVVPLERGGPPGGTRILASVAAAREIRGAITAAPRQVIRPIDAHSRQIDPFYLAAFCGALVIRSGLYKPGAGGGRRVVPRSPPSTPVSTEPPRWAKPHLQRLTCTREVHHTCLCHGD